MIFFFYFKGRPVEGSKKETREYSLLCLFHKLLQFNSIILKIK